MRSYAIDLGGTAIKMAAMEDGATLAEAQLPVNPQHSTATCMATVAGVLADWRRNGIHADAAGIAFAGITDPVHGRVLSVNDKYPDAGSFDFPAWAASQELKLAMDNDANAALMGEVHFGAARGCGDVVILILGTGIGTAAMMGGMLLRGKHFQAGCVCGHFTVGSSARICNCGGRGCAEAYASTWALPALIREQPDFADSALAQQAVLDFRALTQQAREEDATAKRVLACCLDVWAAVVKNLIHAYDPEVVVLSGGVMNSADLIVQPLRTRVVESAWIHWGDVDMRVAENPERSVLLGMHWQACQRIAS